KASRYGGLRRRIKYILSPPVHRKPRLWSNLVFKEIAPFFHGRVLNCSGWADEDKYGGHYRDYFLNASEYAISNLRGGRQVGIYSELADSICLDLEKPLRPELVGRFDLVISHTVLEHVFDVGRAVENLCLLT